MDVLLLLSLSVILWGVSQGMRLRGLRARVAQACFDADVLLRERVKAAMVLEQALLALPKVSNPAAVQALYEVSDLLIRSPKALADRGVEEVRLSKLLVAVREMLAQPFEGAVFAQRDALLAAMRQVDELEAGARALVAMARGAQSGVKVLEAGWMYRVLLGRMMPGAALAVPMWEI